MMRKEAKIRFRTEQVESLLIVIVIIRSYVWREKTNIAALDS